MQYILLTGAAGGMGKATASLLEAQGYGVIALDRSPASVGTWVEADITEEASVLAAFERVAAITDELVAIVHFAGIYMLDSLVEMDTAAFDRIFSVNLRGAYLVNRVFLPLLRPGSRILITTSELAPLAPLPFTGIYAVTKGALDKYAYSLRMELQLLDIRVSVLRAGAVDTGMLGVSTAALDRFCHNTRLYTCNAERFKGIVESVEARNISAERIAQKVLQILKKRTPRFAYSINRNPLLLLLELLPSAVRFWIIRQILKA